jgi:L-amino acid N-acyltransferase YncA
VIRRARSSDAGAIASIYNQAMAPGVFATCDVVHVTAESRVEWLARHDDAYPAFVYEGPAGDVVGWSSLNPFSVRPNYRSIAEVSVYVDAARRGGTVGAALFVRLLDEANRLALRALVSLTFERNGPSLRGLEAAGFRKVATLAEVAWLRGRWESVVWLQKELAGGVAGGRAGDWKDGTRPLLRARRPGDR